MSFNNRWQYPTWASQPNLSEVQSVDFSWYFSQENPVIPKRNFNHDYPSFFFVQLKEEETITVDKWFAQQFNPTLSEPRVSKFPAWFGTFPLAQADDVNVSMWHFNSRMPGLSPERSATFLASRIVDFSTPTPPVAPPMDSWYVQHFLRAAEHPRVADFPAHYLTEFSVPVIASFKTGVSQTYGVPSSVKTYVAPNSPKIFNLT